MHFSIGAIQLWVDLAASRLNLNNVRRDNKQEVRGLLMIMKLSIFLDQTGLFFAWADANGVEL